MENPTRSEVGTRLQEGVVAAQEVAPVGVVWSEVFPFLISWDGSGVLRHVGPSMAKGFPDVVIGRSFSELFRLEFPVPGMTLAEVAKRPGERFVIRHRASDIAFRAQWIAGPGPVAGTFLASPCFASSEQAEGLGLQENDFAAHDCAPDLLNLVRRRQSVVSELELTAESLRLERERLREANERLDQQQREAHKLALVASRTDNAVILTNPAGEIEWVNDGFTRITGYQSHEVMGRKPGSVLQGPKTDPSTVAFIRSRLAAQKNVGVEILNYRKDGAPYWISMEIQPVRDVDGVLTGYMAVERDVSRRRADELRRGIQHAVSTILATAGSVRQASARLIQSLAERIGAELGFVWVMQPQGSSLRCLEWWYRPQLDMREVLELARVRHLEEGEWLPGIVWKAGRPLWLCRLEEARRDGRTEVMLRSGVDSVWAFPVISNKVLLGVVEIYGKKLDEPDDAMLQVLGAIGQQLGQFIARRRAEEDLLKAKEVAEKANEAKSLFLATMSHEIRTPLNGILGFTDLLMESDLGASEREYVQTIRRSGDILLHLINDVLDFSRIESGGMVLERLPMSVRELLEQTMEIHSQAARLKGLTCEWEVEDGVPERILGDPGRTRQILMNLVANAVKFTESGGVVVRVAAADGRLSFSVQDTGIGFHQEQADLLFKPFQQAESSTSRRFGGTGLGLAICHRLLDLMGGGIEAESSPGQGAVFRFHLPLVEAGGAEVSTLAVDEVRTQIRKSVRDGRTILVAEDNPVNSRLIRILLEKMGFRVLVAENGLALIELFEKEPHCEAIFMDIRMPLVDGIEATRRLRSGEVGEAGQRVPIIALTASVFPAEQRAFLASGMNYYLAKPLRPGDLLTGLKAVGVVAAS